MSRVLVTGATGFIGNYVVTELLRRGHHVIASSLSPEKAQQAPWFEQVQYISFDLASFNESTDYFTLFNRPEMMIHLSWEGLPNYKASFHVEINLPRHLAFLTNLVNNGLNSLTVTGTCFEYGMHEGMLSEDMPSNPGNPYALAKDELRKALELQQQVQGFDFKWIRLFYMYGRGQSPQSLLSQLKCALENNDTVFNMSGGKQIRDYLPVEQVAEIIVTIALQNKIGGIVNCCSGQPVSIKKLVERYLQEHNANIQLNTGFYPYTDYEPMSFWGDIKKLKQILQQ